MLDKIKQLLGLSKPSIIAVRDANNRQTPTCNNDTLTSEDYSRYNHVRESSGMGAKIAEFSLNAMIEQIPDFKGYFEIGSQNQDLIIYCIKGFEDSKTMQMLPALWKRKSFIENCRLFGTEQIIFIDKTNNTFDLVKVDNLDISNWQ